MRQRDAAAAGLCPRRRIPWLLLGVCLLGSAIGTLALDHVLSPRDAAEPTTLNRLPAPATSEVPRLSEGMPAPDFTLTRVGDGSPLRLADLYGYKPVVLILSSFT